MCIGLCTTEHSYIPEAGPNNIFERLVDERMDRILYEDDKNMIDSARPSCSQTCCRLINVFVVEPVEQVENKVPRAKRLEENNLLKQNRSRRTASSCERRGSRYPFWSRSRGGGSVFPPPLPNSDPESGDPVHLVTDAPDFLA